MRLIRCICAASAWPPSPFTALFWGVAKDLRLRVLVGGVGGGSPLTLQVSALEMRDDKWMLVGFIVFSVFLRGQKLPSLLIILSYILPLSHEASCHR